MLRANEMKIADPRITYGEISRRTERLGPGLDYMSPRTFFDARNSQAITLTRLHALAHVLRVGVKQIVLEDQSEEALKSRALAPAPAQGLTFVLNFPSELMQTEPIRRLSALPSQTVRQFLDVAISLMSTAETESTTLGERSRQMLIDIAKGRLASQLDDLDAKALFGATRKEKRFERNTRLILEKVVKYLNSKHVPNQKPDQTFLDYFLEYCQKVSDADLQEL
jgi:hypothetical protein